MEAWEAQCEAWRKAGALFRETRDRAASKLGSEHPVTLTAAESLAGWILEDKDGLARVDIEFRAPHAIFMIFSPWPRRLDGVEGHEGPRNVT